MGSNPPAEWNAPVASCEKSGPATVGPSTSIVEMCARAVFGSATSTASGVMKSCRLPPGPRVVTTALTR